MKKRFILFIILLLIIPSFIFVFNDYKNIYADATNFDNFAKNFNNFISDNMYADYKEKCFSLDKDLKKQDSVYMVELEKFIEITGCKYQKINDDCIKISRDDKNVILQNNKNVVIANENENILHTNVIMKKEIFFPIEKVSSLLGFSVEFIDEEIKLSSPYQLKRLIVRSDSSLNNMGAVRVCEGYKNLHFYQYRTEKETIDAFNYYKNNKNVDSVNFDTICHSFNDDITNMGEGDSFSYRTWGAKTIGVKNYSQYLINNIGENFLPETVVAVLDTGIDSSHPWFSGRILNKGKNFSSSGDENNYNDVFGHGTHVSGTIVDLTMKNVKILPIKVLNNQGEGNLSSIIAGYEYIYTLQNQGINIKVINMSLGGPSAVGSAGQKEYTRIVDEAYNKNIISVVAAGNESQDTKFVSPANVEKAITVSAVMQSENSYKRATYSNFGNYVDISAPGTGIVSAGIGGNLVSMNGTSMATPHVSAAVALLYSNNLKNYSLLDIENILDFSCIDLGTLGYDEYYGEGLLNIEYAYANLLDDVCFSNNNTNNNNPFLLEITSNNLDAKIYYTLDGTIPNRSTLNLYTKPINISESVIVKAVAYVTNAQDDVIGYSKISTKKYVINGQDIKNPFIVSKNGELLEYIGLLKDVVVPKSVNAKIITSVGENAFMGSNIDSITLDKSVVLIKKNAFYRSKIKNIFAPGVEEIDDFSFRECKNLTSLTDANFKVLKNIGKASFMDCFNIEKVFLANVENINIAGFFMSEQNRSLLTDVDLKNIKVINDNAFLLCSNLTNVNIKTATTITNNAFNGCNISSISLDSAKNIGNYAFASNPLTLCNMPNVELVCSNAFMKTKIKKLQAEKLKQINNEAFSHNEQLTDVYLPNVEKIGERAFVGCNKLTDISLNNVKQISSECFSGLSSLSSVSLKNVRVVGKNAFYNCKGLNSVVIGSTLNEIDDTAFNGVPVSCIFVVSNGSKIHSFATNKGFSVDVNVPLNILYKKINNEIHITGYNNVSNDEEIIIPSMIENLKVTKICGGAFKQCLKIKELNLTYLEEIDDEAFYSCSNLTKIDLPNIEKIGVNSFYSCNNLNKANIKNVYLVKENAFLGCDKLNSVLFTNNVDFIGQNAFGYKTNGLKNNNFYIECYNGSNAHKYANNNHINFSIIYKSIPTFYFKFYENNGQNEIEIAFVDSSYSGSLTFPSEYQGNTISAIGENAFSNCSFIKEINLPSTIKIINNGAFLNCSSLEKINLENVEIIGENAFFGCDNLNELRLFNTRTLLTDAISNESIKKVVISNQLNSCHGNVLNINSVVYGYKNSYIQSYCNSKNIKFVAIDNLTITKNLPSNLSVNQLDEINLSVSVAGFDVKYDWYETSFSYNEGVLIYGEHKNILNIDTNNVGNKKYFAIIKDWQNNTLKTNICDVKINKITTYKISASCGEGGSITPSGDVIVKENASQTFRVSINEHYVIKEILIDGVALSSDDIQKVLYNGYTFNNVIKDHTIKVSFKDKLYTLTSSFVGEGTITPFGEIKKKFNESISYSIIPNPGYHIDKIVIDGTNILSNQEIKQIENSQTYTFKNIDKDHSIKVTFAINKYKIVAGTLGNGQISPIGTMYLDYLTAKTFNFNPDFGYYLKDILLDGKSIGKSAVDDAIKNGFTLKDVKQDHRIVAEFSIIENTVKIELEGNGTVSPLGNKYISYNDDLTINVAANLGAYLHNVILDGTNLNINDIKNIQSTKQYVLKNITKNITIKFIFKTIQIKIFSKVLSEAKTGSITPIGETALNYGDCQTYIIQPSEGYEVESIFIDEKTLSANEIQNVINSGYTFNNVIKDHNISVKFVKKQFKISVSTQYEDGNPESKEYQKQYGEQIDVLIPSVEGQYLEQIIINDLQVTKTMFDDYVKAGKVNITNIQKNYSICLIFKKYEYNIDYISFFAGNKEEKTKKIKHGKNFNLKVRNDHLIVVENILVDGNEIDKDKLEITKQNKVFTLEKITKNHNVVIKYIFKNYKVIVTYNDASLGKIETNQNLDMLIYNNNAEIKIIPNDGYKVGCVYIDDIPYQATNNIVLLQNITRDINLKIDFIKIEDTKTENLDIAKIKIIKLSLIAILPIISTIVIFIISKNKKA